MTPNERLEELYKVTKNLTEVLVSIRTIEKAELNNIKGATERLEQLRSDLTTVLAEINELLS